MQEKNRRRLIALLVVLPIVLGVGAIFSTYIYDNSPAGIGKLISELFGAGLLVLIFAIPARRATYTPAIALAIAALAVGVGNTLKLIDSIDARRGMKELSAVRDPSQIEQALKKDPSNTFLQLMTGAAKLAQYTDRTTAELLTEIEPPALGKDINFATATRAALQAYLSNLKTAETNAEAAMPRFAAVAKKERDDVESLSRSLNVSDDLTRNVLAGVDKRQAKFLAFTSEMMAAGVELYRALGTYVAVLVEQHGNYTVEPNGQYQFQNSSVVVGFNVAANAVKVAARRVAELEVEGKQLTKSQQEGWERFRSMK
ncbi:MAG: hypothetical protein WAU99_00425 [Pseudolabrys sp.]